MSFLARLAVTLASPLKLVDVRSASIERSLGLPLTEQDAQFVRQSGDGIRIGAYYHWYLQKLVVARAIRGLDRPKALALVQAIDQTDYRDIRQVVDSPSGVLVAIPHHAHYILSMTALAEQLGKHRKVNVFYGQPATHKGNAVFDHLHQILFSAADSGVEVIHDTRQGLAKAIRGLKNGEIVFIMPDAAQDEEAAMMMPFCGRLMNTMLGTAVLARKTGSWIMPAVSMPNGSGLGFRTCFGNRIDHPAKDMPLTAEQTRVADYGVTRRMFSQFEEWMGGQLYLWQNVRGHMANGSAVQPADADALPSLLDAVSGSPAFKAPDLVLDLR